MALSGWIDAKALRLALGPTTYMAIYDDAKTKDQTFALVDNSDQVKQALALSASEVASYLPSLWPDLPPQLPSSASQLLADAQLMYAKLLAYQRHPEYVKTYDAGPGGKLEERFRAKMARIQSGIQQIVTADAPAAEDPAIVGGSFKDDGKRMLCTDPDGTDNFGDW